MKSQLVIIFLLLISTQANSQNKIGIEVNPYYMTNAKSKSWSFYLSPPLFSGNTLRYQLAQDLKGRVRQIPPNFFLFDVGVQKFIATHIAVGIQYQHSSADAKDAILFEKSSGLPVLTDLTVNSDNLMLTTRYYYDIVIKNLWDAEKNPKSAKRLRKSWRKVVLFSGFGIGYGETRFTTPSQRDLVYPALTRLNKVVLGIELLGVQYYFNRHIGAFTTFGSFAGIYFSGRIPLSGHAGIFINP